MAPLSDEGRKIMEAAIAEAWLLSMNQYAYENELIDKETYLKMQIKIKTGYAVTPSPQPTTQTHIA